jgi:hypothetical protein
MEVPDARRTAFGNLGYHARDHRHVDRGHVLFAFSVRFGADLRGISRCRRAWNITDREWLNVSRRQQSQETRDTIMRERFLALGRQWTALAERIEKEEQERKGRK